jgi:carbon-monoxide dehydrogenase large subunit
MHEMTYSATKETTGIGSSVRRKEDHRLLTGQGRFSDDWRFEGEAYACFVRSTRAHARIIRIDTALAREDEAVLNIFTGQDVAFDGVQPIPARASIKEGPDVNLYNRDGSAIFTVPQDLLPIDKVRFVGEAVAMVVAETKAAAAQAAERVIVEYDELPAVTSALDALRADAPRVWESRDTNICIDADLGDPLGVERAFAKADYVARLTTWIQRVSGAPLEPRAAVGIYDAEARRYTLYSGGGGVVRHKGQLMAVMGEAADNVRVVNRDVGGSFGTRNNFYRESGLVCWAARKVGRPVKWTSSRHECFLSDYQGRDLHVEAELALDASGKFLAVRSTNVSNLGSHTVAFTPLAKGAGLMSGNYDIPVAHVRALAVLTNTVPTTSYRSAGRPEATFVIERLIDIAATECNIDRVELRRRNLIVPERMPYANPLGLTYDNGSYGDAMEAALRMCDWDRFESRRREARRRGVCRGFGIANYIEITTGDPRERTEITVSPEGWVEVVIGTQSTGQGHETSFAQLISEWLGLPMDRVRLIQGDTDRVTVGGGSHSGRSMRLAGIIIGEATSAILEKAKRAAAELLGVSTEDLIFACGHFFVVGMDRSLDLFSIAAAMVDGKDLSEDLRGKLEAVCEKTVKFAGYPYGAHACEVEVDPDTGRVDIVAYGAVDDVGRAVNPMILHGQTHGGAAQGIGQAMLEQILYDPADGQLLTGSFMDYCIPRATTLPMFRTEISEVASPSNQLGIRAGGEGGTTPALAVVIGAIVDALSEFGVRHIEMPATPEKVWRAIRSAKEAREGSCK